MKKRAKSPSRKKRATKNPASIPRNKWITGKIKVDSRGGVLIKASKRSLSPKKR